VYLALTDHDTVEGVPDAIAEGNRLGITVIPGTELSAERNGREAHILGYFVDLQNEYFLRDLDAFAQMRTVRIEKIVEKLRALGFDIDLDRVNEIAGPGTIGRPHVARALIEKGYATDVSDAFNRFLSSGRPGYIPRKKITPQEAVGLIVRAGGVPVLAHPYSTRAVEESLEELVPLGLRGLEVYYGEYSEAQRDELRRIAERWNLIPTGGSDFHGPGVREGRDLAGPFVPIDSVERLKSAVTG
jgi:hypothetical protein